MTSRKGRERAPRPEFDLDDRQESARPAVADTGRLAATGSTHPPTMSARAMLSLQRRAGNQAVQRLLRPASTTPAPPADVAVQRFKNFDRWFSKKTNFESTAFSASIGGALNITKTGAGLELGSADYEPTGTVTANGPKDRVKGYKLGWVQTVYESNRSFYYSPKDHERKWGGKILPGLLGERKVITDTLKTQPVRDGDTGVKPWYEINDAVHFDNAPTSTKSTRMYDAPETNQPWTIDVAGTKQYLVKTRGADVFRTWLITRNEETESITRLNYADWRVDYGTNVTPDYANPAASAVVATTGGAKVTAVEEGTGLRWPLLGDPTANDEAYDKESKW